MDTRKEKFPHGIPGHNLGEIEREIPIEEPPVWPINDELKIIGKRVTRIDALEKVTGNAKIYIRYKTARNVICQDVTIQCASRGHQIH